METLSIRLRELDFSFQTPYGELVSNGFAKPEFIRYIKTGLSPRISEGAQTLPEEEVDSYIWRTQGDDRVRGSHADREGKVFSVDDSPCPGEEYGCRCWAEKCVESKFLPYDFNLRPDNPAKQIEELSVSDKGVKYIADWEKFRPNIYLDQAGNPTIGYGHLIDPEESFANGITMEEALKLFKEDLADTENALYHMLKIPLTQNQFDALVSLVFNFGAGKFSSTECLRYLNERRFDLAREEFLDINKILNPKTGKLEESEGLTIRRQQEWDMFENGVYNSAH